MMQRENLEKEEQSVIVQKQSEQIWQRDAPVCGKGVKTQKRVEPNRQNSWNEDDFVDGFHDGGFGSDGYREIFGRSYEVELRLQQKRSEQGVGTTFLTQMCSSLAEDEEEGTTFVTRTKTPKRRRKRNAALLMKADKRFSSSSSSSSESENHATSRKTGIDRCCLSLSSALSTDSLKGELSLPDLLITETGEEDDVFVDVEAEQVTVAAQTRSTDDLFAVIHSTVWEGTA